MARDILEFIGIMLALVAVLTLLGITYIVLTWAFIEIAFQASDCACSVNWIVPTAAGIGGVLWELVCEIQRRGKDRRWLHYMS